MRTSTVLAALVVSGMLCAGPVRAGPWEDGVAAYNRGDYIPAVGIIRPLAIQGNAKAQALLGTMYHKGEGVGRSASRAFMWLSIASNRGDHKAAEDLKILSKTMTAEERQQASEMVKVCESSQFNACPY